MGLDEVADELYGVPPEGFVARRAELVKQAKADGDKALATQIGALRRPTAAAWVVNALVRERPDELDRLLDLGEALRSAQAALAGEELRALTKQRQQVVAAMARQSRALARELGHPVSQSVADEVEETLRSALADPDVAAAVRSGRLTTSISYAGMGETAPPRLADVVALGPRQDRRAARDAQRAADRGADGSAARDGDRDAERDAGRDAEKEAARAAAQRAAREAERARLTEAVRQARAEADTTGEDGVDAARALDRARSEHESARQRVRDLEDQLQAAQAALAGTGDALGRARKDNDAATKAAATAARALAVAEEALARASDDWSTTQ